MGRAWTPEDIAHLRAAYKAGVSYADIAVQLGRSTSSVTSAAHRFRTQLGAPRSQRWTPDQDCQLTEDFERGGDLAAVARALGRSPAATAERRRTLAGPITPRPRAFTEQLDQQLVEAWRQGKTIQWIADGTALPAHAVTTRITALRRTGRQLQARPNSSPSLAAPAAASAGNSRPYARAASTFNADLTREPRLIDLPAQDDQLGRHVCCRLRAWPMRGVAHGARS